MLPLKSEDVDATYKADVKYDNEEGDDEENYGFDHFTPLDHIVYEIFCIRLQQWVMAAVILDPVRRRLPLRWSVGNIPEDEGKI